MNSIGRQLAEGDYLKLKAAFRHLVKLVGGCEAAAGITRVAKTRISDAGNPALDCFPAVDVVADLEAAAGLYPVTHALQQIGQDTAPPRPPMTVVQVVEAAARIATELGDYSTEALNAAADGKVTDTELNALIKEMQDILFAAQHGHDDLCRLRDSRRQALRAV